jgi:Protein of unknown function (DUF2924)
MDIASRLRALPALTTLQLREEWNRVFGRPAPSNLRRELIIRILGYRIQEQVFGGFSAATRHRLRTLARMFEKDSRAMIPCVPIAKPGTRLVRVWKGQTHVVTVAESGFEYKGRRHESLSQIARLITGTRWSGPLFFGLKSHGTKEPTHGR